ncbi:GW dipeptide domain-containing protein [Leuconostoc gasicomitatum]|uniref:GW dipeptide domain-containing protein n=1 Tax=Leuconostoc gasicomitatum TaxID=115778 RepID=UPI00214DB20D|nr:GW dipeptide domain-containing protein [Leuconostoc gasicomitatum]
MMKKFLISAALLSTTASTALLMTNNVSADAGQGQSYIKTTSVEIPLRGIDGGIWSHPYGQKGATHLGNVRAITGKTVTAYSAYKDTDSGTLWIEILFNGQRGWVDANTLTERSNIGYFDTRFVNVRNFQTTVNKPAVVHAKATGDNRFDNDFGRDKAITFGGTSGIVGSLAPYNGKSVEVRATFIDRNNVTWAQIRPLTNQNLNTDDLSWVDASRLTFKDTTGIQVADVASKDYKVTLFETGDVWTRPYGLKNSQWMRTVKSLGTGVYAVDKVAISNSYAGDDRYNHWIHLKNVGWVHGGVAKFVNEHKNGRYISDPKYHFTSYKEAQYDPFVNGGITGYDTLIRGYDGLPGFDNWYY